MATSQQEKFNAMLISALLSPQVQAALGGKAAPAK